MTDLVAALTKRWQAINPNADFDPTRGFDSHWAKLENTWWGAPLDDVEGSITFEGADRPLRVFANAVVVWMPDGPRVLTGNDLPAS